jgi:hypothetical protein
MVRSRECTHVRPVERFIPARNAETTQESVSLWASRLRGAPGGMDGGALTENSVKGIMGQPSKL